MPKQEPELAILLNQVLSIYLDIFTHLESGERTCLANVPWVGPERIGVHNDVPRGNELTAGLPVILTKEAKIEKIPESAEVILRSTAHEAVSLPFGRFMADTMSRTYFNLCDELEACFEHRDEGYAQEFG